MPKYLPEAMPGLGDFMGPIASAAARSAIATTAVFILFVAAEVTLLDAPMEWRLRAIQRSFTELGSLIVAALGWLAYFGWVTMEQHKAPVAHSQIVHIGLAVVSTVLTAAAIVALYECVGAAFRGFFWLWGWHYWLRMFEGSLFAVAIVRIALPLVPRFDRMTSHNV